MFVECESPACVGLLRVTFCVHLCSHYQILAQFNVLFDIQFPKVRNVRDVCNLKYDRTLNVGIFPRKTVQIFQDWLDVLSIVSLDMYTFVSPPICPRPYVQKVALLPASSVSKNTYRLHNRGELIVDICGSLL